jgi:hypothetical protein
MRGGLTCGEDDEGYPRARLGKTRDVHSETDKQYPDEDPDTEPATSPAEVDSDSERDQAEGDEDTGADA